MATRRFRRAQVSRRTELELAAAADAPRRRGPIAPWIVAGVVAVLVVSGVSAGFVVAAKAGCDGAPTTLTVVTSPDQQKVVADLAASWQHGKPSVDGRCATVSVKAAASNSVADALSPDWASSDSASGDSASGDEKIARPDVWIPESSTWVLSAARRQDVASMVSGDRVSVASSPAVMAMPQAMAEAFGWPTRQLSWSDFIAAHFYNKTWANYGHPEWGSIKLGMTEPTTSTAGLLDLIPLSDRDGDDKITLNEAKALLVFSRTVNSRAADSTAFFSALKKAPDQKSALRTISAFPAIEQQISAYNQSDPKAKLVPIYPVEGTVFADYPYTVLNASWVDTFRKKIAASFLGYLETDTAKRAFGDAGFRDPDRSTKFAGATLGDVGFSEQVGSIARNVGSAATVDRTVVYWTALERTTTFLAVIDTSGSMSEKLGTQSRMQVVQDAAIKAISLFDDDSHVGLWQFSTNLVGNQDWRQVIPLVKVGSKDSKTGKTWRQTGIQAVLGLRPGGNTGLYDTVLAAYKYMQKNWQPRQLNLVVVLTDGKNEDSNGISRAALLSQLRSLAEPDRPIQVITLGIGNGVDATELGQISSATGGKSYQAKDAADLERLWLATILGETPPN